MFILAPDIKLNYPRNSTFDAADVGDKVFILFAAYMQEPDVIQAIIIVNVKTISNFKIIIINTIVIISIIGVTSI